MNLSRGLAALFALTLFVPCLAQEGLPPPPAMVRFTGHTFPTPRINQIMRELDALAAALEQEELAAVDTPRDAAGYEGEDEVDTPGDAEGYPGEEGKGLVDVLVHPPSDAEGYTGEDHDGDGFADVVILADPDLERYSGRLVHDGGPRLAIGSGEVLELIGPVASLLRTLRDYEGEVAISGRWSEGRFEVDEILSPKEASVRGTYYPGGPLLVGEDGARIELGRLAIPSLHAKPVRVAGWRDPQSSAFLAVGIHAMTSRIATVSVTYGNGHMRDFEVGEHAHLVIRSEVGDRYRILIDGVRATVLKADVILQD
ncbi:MAG: hypothetical protein R3F62_03360 [Planctomycetota bacterium]